MMMKKFLALLVLSSFYSGMSFGVETQEQVDARRQQERDAKIAKKNYDDAEIKRTRAASKEAKACLGTDPSKSEACKEASILASTATDESDALKKQLDEKAAISDNASTDARYKTEDSDRKCKAYEEAAKAAFDTGSEGQSNAVPGSNAMAKCQALAGNRMKNLYGSQRGSFDWNIAIEATPECIAASPQCGAKPDKVKLCNNIKKFAAKCDGAAYLINEFARNWETPEHVKPAESKGGNPEIKCSSVGIETLDYEACAKFVQNGDIMDAAQAAIQTGQDLYYKDKAMTAQMEASSSADSATASLKALKTGVKGQEDIMIQRAAIDTGKFAALATYYSEIPTYDDLTQKCANYRSVVTKPASSSAKENDCVSAVSEHPSFAFLQNQTAKEKMKAKLAKVGIDVASNVVMANLLSKRANDIDNAIAKVDAFKPIDPLAPASDNLQSTYCQQNPGDAKCLTGGLERTFDAMGDNVITFGDGATGTSYNNPNPYVDPTAGTTGSNSPGSKNAIPGVGSVIAANHQDGGLESRAAAATISKGTAPPAGGGGGASGGGAGGGGGATPGAQPQGGTSAAIQGKTPGYNGGGGTLSMMGGYGINKNKGAAKEDGNPFGKLFNKDGNKSAVLNFGRGPASVGNKGDNLFEMISKRYTTVSSDKRLIEYEMTK